MKSCHKFTVIDEITKMYEKAFESIFIKIALLKSTVLWLFLEIPFK